MDIATIIGIVIGFSLIIYTVLTGGAANFFLEPTSFLIVFGGTTAATLVNFPMPKVLTVVKVAKRAFSYSLPETTEMIKTLVNLSTKARVDGLLALEGDIAQIEDEFLQKGIRYLVDGLDAEVVRNLLTTEIVSLEERHALGQSIFKTMGAFAPAFGMLGTLMGLIAMLSKLNDPSKIGTGMAVALVTTFWGVVIANVVCLPIAGKLKMRSAEEVRQMELIIEGLSSIQAGDNPRTLQEKLTIFLAPHARSAIQEEKRPNE